MNFLFHDGLDFSISYFHSQILERAWGTLTVSLLIQLLPPANFVTLIVFVFFVNLLLRSVVCFFVAVVVLV